ncbi:hypothetical protein [Mesorhizobium sp.]|uniref:hypothetical protein n=1 Tax=Mesorhizobium sp. TaxID=1871066 RepID=UPI0025CB95E4|nr:hypothetical protein [Mesorhizobium sp.]
MDENILTAIGGLDKSKSLGAVEPLHGSSRHMRIPCKVRSAFGSAIKPDRSILSSNIDAANAKDRKARIDAVVSASCTHLDRGDKAAVSKADELTHPMVNPLRSRWRIAVSGTASFFFLLSSYCRRAA